MRLIIRSSAGNGRRNLRGERAWGRENNPTSIGPAPKLNVILDTPARGLLPFNSASSLPESPALPDVRLVPNLRRLCDILFPLAFSSIYLVSARAEHEQSRGRGGGLACVKTRESGCGFHPSVNKLHHGRIQRPFLIFNSCLIIHIIVWHTIWTKIPYT